MAREELKAAFIEKLGEDCHWYDGLEVLREGTEDSRTKFISLFFSESDEGDYDILTEFSNELNGHDGVVTTVHDLGHGVVEVKIVLSTAEINEQTFLVKVNEINTQRPFMQQ